MAKRLKKVVHQYEFHGISCHRQVLGVAVKTAQNASLCLPDNYE
jgi:hypothetical protein